MLTCEGYRMLNGTAKVTMVEGAEPMVVKGTWLFNPEVGYWYVSGSEDFPWGSSFEEGAVEFVDDTTEFGGGKWLYDDAENPTFRICSKCGAVYHIHSGDGPYNACPSCFSDMR